MRLNEVILSDQILQGYTDKTLEGLLGSLVAEGKVGILGDIDKCETIESMLLAVVNWWKQVIKYSLSGPQVEYHAHDLTAEDFALAVALLLLLLDRYVLDEEELLRMRWDEDISFEKAFKNDAYNELVNFIYDIKSIFKMIFIIAERSQINYLFDERWLSIWRYLGLTIAPVSIREERTHLFPIQGYDHDYYITWH